MSRTIDERVVEMRFDNKQFESGAATTMSTLQKLKKSLDFSKVGDSFKNIDKAANNVNLSGLDRAISGITGKFSALEVMAITTLGNITNSFVNSAKRWVSAFTIDPVRTGFQEYETQINAVQTILANTQKEGTNIKDVNAALDELNLYADKTIYNFTEMTRNIGTFTAAGVDLKTSVGAIQGIANLAAVSGSNSEQASRAMYQLSQALASGTVKLMDWNSVVQAGMGGQIFQDALTETSRLLGTGADAAIKAEGTFRESLKTGWLTSEVLTETLKKFTTSGAAEYVANYTGLSKEAIEAEMELAKSTYGEAEAIDKAAEALAEKSGKNKEEIAETLRFAKTAEDAAIKVKTFTQLIGTLKEAVQSGWSQSFRIIVGDFEEAKELFTEISESFGAVIGASADARNKLLSEVFNKKDAQSYMASIVDVPKESISELQTIAKEAGTTSDAFKDALNEFTKGDKTLNKVTRHLIEMVSSEKNVVDYISDMTGMEEDSVRNLQKLGREVGYTSFEFKNLANVLSQGDPEMEATITHLLKMSEAMEKPSGRELLIDALRNGMKGLISVIKPVQEAFKEVFPPATADQVYGMLEAFHEFTKTLTLSEKNSKNLKKGFKGLFDIVKLISDGFISLFKIIVPIEEPVGALGDGIFSLVGAFGDLASTISEAIRSNWILLSVLDTLRRGSKAAASGLSALIKTGISFVERLSKMEGTTKLINALNNSFERLYKKGAAYVNSFLSEINDLFDSLFEFKGIDIDDTLKVMSDAFSDLAHEINNFSFKTVERSFESLKTKLKEFSDLLMSNSGIGSFIKNSKKYGEELREAFTLDNLLDRLEKVMDIFGKFFNWIKTVIGPAFADFNVGSALAAGGGLGIIYALIKATNAFDKISDAIKSFPDLLGGVKGVLVSYQRDLQADALIKVAKAIGILAIAITILSFADMERAWQAAIMLGLVGAALIAATGYFIKAKNSANSVDAAATIIAESVGKAIKNIGKAIKIRAIAGLLKSFAISIAIISGSIVALGVMWRKDQVAFKNGVLAIAGITGALIVLGALSGDVAVFGNAWGMSQISKSILLFSLSLGIIVFAISSLMKMKIPDDYEKRLGLLYGIFKALAALTFVLAVDAWFANGNELPEMTKAIKSLAVLLVATVLSLKILFGMKIPNDYEAKLGILKGIFVGLGILVLAMAAAARISGGNGFKAGTTIMAMAAFLVVAVGSLFVLSIMPLGKILKGILAVRVILVALGVALAGAGTISNPDASKAVMAMAITIGVITAALSILSMIPWEKLAVSVAALSSVLGVLSLAFFTLSKVKIKDAVPAVLSMIVAMGAITALLYILSNQPWEGVLAATAGLSATLIALTACLAIASMAKVNLAAVGALALGSASLLLIAASIAILANYDGEKLLASTLALSATLAVMIIVMAACSALSAVIGPAMIGVLGLGAVIAELALVLAAIGAFAQIPNLKWFINEGGDLLQLIGTALGKFVGGLVGGIMTGVSSQLPQIGLCLSLFMRNLTPFILGAKLIDDKVLVGVGVLAACIVAITAAEMLAGIGSFLGGAVGFISLASNLVLFIITLQPFLNAIKGVSPESIEATKNLAQMIIILTAADILSGIGSFLGFSGNLSDFGSQLVAFGPDIRTFANQVKDVKPEAVQGAASAAEIMATMANKLPAQGGIAQTILGTKSLSDFGSQLVAFGPDIRTFANQVKDVKPEAVQGAASAAEIMATMANKLPSSDSLLSSIFGGGKISLSEFGNQLVSFGTSITNFSNSVAGVNAEQINGAVQSFKLLAGLAQSTQDISADGLVSFTNQLSQIGSGALDGFVQAFSNSGPKVSAAISVLLSNIESGLRGKAESFRTIGTIYATYWLSGISFNYQQAYFTGTMLVNYLLFALQFAVPMFLVKGFLSASQYLFGIKNKYFESISVGRGLANNALAGCQAVVQGFYNAGANAGQGFVDGLRSKISDAAKAGKDLAEAALEAAKRYLDEHSPSKKMGEVGDYAGLGFVQQLLAHVASAEEAGKKLGEAAYKGTASVVPIFDDFDIDPTIHPRVDLDDVRKSVDDINRMFNESISYTGKIAKSVSSSISASKQGGEIQNGQSKALSDNGNTYQFVQNNYSPKALSRIEIYRDTKNQFYQFKEATDK